MVTEGRPRHDSAGLEYDASDRLAEIAVPGPDGLPSILETLEAAREGRSRRPLERACQEVLDRCSDFYGIARPSVKLLGVRPHSTREGRLSYELFGDYAFENAEIRLWTRTPIQRQPTSTKTLLSTLCHEFMHHLDATKLGFSSSYHTAGFFERTHRLYLGIQGLPHYPLAWLPPDENGSRAIDWPMTNFRKRHTHVPPLDRG